MNILNINITQNYKVIILLPTGESTQGKPSKMLLYKQMYWFTIIYVSGF